MAKECKYQNRCVQFKSWCVNHVCSSGVCGTYSLANACGKDVENSEYCLYQMVYNQLVQKEQFLNEIERLATNAFCLTNGTNKDVSNFAKQILDIINKAKE